MKHGSYILGIESSCDDTAAAIIRDNVILSNVVANQKVHQKYGGVVPELASRAHQQNIVPVITEALGVANITQKDLSAIAYTKGPGLMGSLLVGSSFAKSLSLALTVPLLEVNHMHGHIMAHFIADANEYAPRFPFLCLTVSGGHTQIVLLKDYFDLAVLGETIDDAAGEAFDKIGKLLGLAYPAGPEIDRLAKKGNPHAFKFTIPNVKGLNFSYSGLKTGVRYFVEKKIKENSKFIAENLNDLCASVQYTIVESLVRKLVAAARETGINQIAIAGGVSANEGLRDALLQMAASKNWTVFLPKFEYTTDNAAMIAMSGQLLYEKQEYGLLRNRSLSRWKL